MSREINRTPRPSLDERLYSELAACRALIDARENENVELRVALKRLWEAVQKSNDPQSPDFIPASLPMFRILDDIAERYPFVKEDDNESKHF